MWFVLDIGNSAVKGAFVEGAHLHEPFRLALTQDDPPDAWEAALREQVRGRSVTRAGLASVVPPLTSLLQTLLPRLTRVDPVVVHHRMKLPFALAYETPHTMGTDRLAAAAAAWVLYGHDADGAPRSVVALDAGTAVTCEVIDRAGTFRGGTIGAGPQLLRDALRRGTAQLPAVPLDLPATPVGRSTREALQAGIMYAFLDSIHGMLGRIGTTLGETPFVVATGGWGSFLHHHIDAIDHIDPHLVLQGVRVLMGLNAT